MVMTQAERSLFTESNKRCFHWIDEWFGLTYEDVRRMEVENDRSLNQVHTSFYTIQNLIYIIREVFAMRLSSTELNLWSSFEPPHRIGFNTSSIHLSLVFVLICIHSFLIHCVPVQKLGKTSMESDDTENVSSSSEPVKKDASLPSSVSVRS